MGMARIPVAELRVQTQGPGLVRVTASAPAREGRDLREWVQQSGISPGAMVTTGLVLAVLGGLGLLVLASGSFAGVVALASMVTTGAGLAFLGALKRKDAKAEPKALPPASSAAVLTERSRRVRAVLDGGGGHTFEQLLHQLRWTESALLETLVVMKDGGQVVEDLDLDTGEWVYRSQELGFGGGGPMSLADRQAHGRQEETHRR